MKHKKILLTITLLSLVCFNVFAHPGRTDSNGGHWNRSTGEYHYHHGHEAHQHPDGICPYSTAETPKQTITFDESPEGDIQKEKSTNSATNSSVITATIVVVSGLMILLLVFKRKS